VLCFHVFAVRLHQLLVSTQPPHGAFLFCVRFRARFESFAYWIRICMRDRVPNKSPEPTAVGAVSSAVAVHVASRRWLSFLR